MGSERDYYADLELPPTADIQEIKKQFRKLALKYHPDRNPGKEQEVNSRFQVIQSAHEVLSDPDSKAKYDVSRTRSRYPTSSGVKGNPWANAGSQFPPPPRRNQPNRSQPPPQPSGAQRWQNRFSTGVPPTARQGSGSDAEAKQSYARAFENMRKGPPKSYQQEPRPTPPPPPPRTESARQRAQASFGARKTGYQPRSAMPGDEPPVTSSNYTSRPDTERYAYTPEPTNSHPTMPDPLSQFREREGSIDARQRTPYTAHGGEKTNPFDGIPLGRTRSTRDTSRQDDTYSSDEIPSARQRSASVPKDTDADSPTTPKSQKQAQQPNTTGRPNDARPKAPLKKNRAVPSFNVGSNASTGSAPTAPPPKPPKVPVDETSDKPKKPNASGPPMYDTPFCSKYHHTPFTTSRSTPYDTSSIHQLRSTWAANHSRDAACRNTPNQTPSSSKTPSGDCDLHPHLSPFEWQQGVLLSQLISNMHTGATPTKKGLRKPLILKDPIVSNTADFNDSNSFNFDMNGDDTSSQTAPDMHQFMRRSTDNINTSFANGNNPASWQFHAGGGEDGHPESRSQSRSRTGRHSPSKRPPPSRTETPEPPSESGTSDATFNPEGWSDKFGPQTFVPQRSQTNSASPTKSNRANIKKPRAAKVTPENVNDSSSDEETFAWRGRKPQAQPVAAESPQAMDIDSPPVETAKPSAQGVPSSFTKMQEARTLYVKPSNPAWQDDSGSEDEKVNGDIKKSEKGSRNETRAEEPKAGGVNPPEPTPAEPAKSTFVSNNVGSEDSEEFRASFADLKNVAPFGQQPTGLKSFADLKANLPFESKASPDIPIQMPKPPSLAFPSVPTAPHVPSTVFIAGMKPTAPSWEKYVKEFETYLRQWDAFNAQVVDHFATRKGIIAKSRALKGYEFLEARGDSDFLQYCNWVQQDMDVQRRWVKSCEEHQQRLREFMAFKQKMK